MKFSHLSVRIVCLALAASGPTAASAREMTCVPEILQRCDDGPCQVVRAGNAGLQFHKIDPAAKILSRCFGPEDCDNINVETGLSGTFLSAAAVERGLFFRLDLSSGAYKEFANLAGSTFIYTGRCR